MSARPPEGVETVSVYRCRKCGTLTTESTHCYVKGPPLIPQMDKHSLCDPVDAVALDVFLAELEARERAERERDDALLGKGRREAVIEALARSEGESENTLLRSALAVIFTALGGRLPTRTSEAAAFALERLEQLTDLAADRDAAVARAEQAEAERDELRKKLREISTYNERPGYLHADIDRIRGIARAALGNGEGTSTTAEAARDVGPEPRNSERRF